jgi:hypothetical protein
MEKDKDESIKKEGLVFHYYIPVDPLLGICSILPKYIGALNIHSSQEVKISGEKYVSVSLSE